LRPLGCMEQRQRQTWPLPATILSGWASAHPGNHPVQRRFASRAVSHRHLSGSFTALRGPSYELAGLRMDPGARGPDCCSPQRCRSGMGGGSVRPCAPAARPTIRIGGIGRDLGGPALRSKPSLEGSRSTAAAASTSDDASRSGLSGSCQAPAPTSFRVTTRVTSRRTATPRSLAWAVAAGNRGLRSEHFVGRYPGSGAPHPGPGSTSGIEFTNVCAKGVRFR
jgi:hypothetical protein